MAAFCMVLVSRHVPLDDEAGRNDVRRMFSAWLFNRIKPVLN